MRRSTWRLLLWQGLGLLCYVAGMLLFLVVAIGVFLAPPENSLSNLSVDHLPFILASLVLIVLGRVISWKYGGGSMLGGFRPDQPETSPLEDLGYRVPSESTDDSDTGFRYEDGEMTIVCPECGTENDPDYTYCRDCSAQLPE